MVRAFGSILAVALGAVGAAATLLFYYQRCQVEHRLREVQTELRLARNKLEEQGAVRVIRP